MARKGHDGLTALASLRSILGEKSFLEVIHENGYLWKAYFTFHDPAKLEDVTRLREQLNIPLPRAYENFLLHYDGAVLYYDDEYGQWGYQLYGTNDLITRNEHWKKRYGRDWPPAYLAFAESFGDADFLILDTNQLTNEGNDCRLIDGDSGYLPSRWNAVAPGFGDWLDRLIVAQGAKYWRWYP